MKLFDFQKAVPFTAILLLGALLWGTEYVRRDLWAPDEARFALVSKEMREGHWLVPFRQGEFYTHKPPLMFWLTNLFSLITGGEIGNVAPRLPSFLGAVMALWAATQLAARWFSARASWLTLLILPSSFLFWNKGGFGQIDMLLCGLEMMALYFLFTSQGLRAPGRIFAAYAFMGLGILAKGPVGFIVPLGAYIAATLYSRETFAKPASHWIWGPIVALAFPAAWLGAAWMQGAPEGFFNELLFDQNLGRVQGEFGGHNKPFYYFLMYFPLDFLPWSLALPLSWLALKREPEHEAGRRKLIAWILFVIVFFSLSSSKRNLYILLAHPAAAMLVAAAMAHWPKVPETWIRRTYGALWGFITVLGSGMVIGSMVPQIPFNRWTLLPAGLALTAGMWLTRKARMNAGLQQDRWAMTMAGSLLAGFSLIGALVYHAVDDLKTPDELIKVAQEVLQPDELMIAYDMNGEIYSLYANRKGFMAHKLRHPNGDPIEQGTNQKFIQFINTSPQTNHLLIANEKDLPEIQTMIGNIFSAHPFSAGSKKLIWIAFQREAGSSTLRPLRTSFDQPAPFPHAEK